ncbi:MAG TPA: PEMT/PEM2 methyltransferase family protein [Gemmatimonadales bacterium]|nr:PEMT/PEM2 methyltransferase family protein [Gemmatimonadales bacterium]
MTWIALAYHLASRLAYVLYVGLTLNRQDRTAYLTRRHGAEEGFRRFRRVAAFVMANDAVSFGLLCLVSANTLTVGLPRGLEITVGAVLALVGVATKIWAAATLGDGYYWRNFFTPTDRVVPKAAGPYRWLKNPMYTVGYLPVYGLALATASAFGLVAALFDQCAILLFYHLVEKPHFERWRQPPSEPVRPAPGSARPPSLDTARGQRP